MTFCFDNKLISYSKYRGFFLWQLYSLNNNSFNNSYDEGYATKHENKIPSGEMDAFREILCFIYFFFWLFWNHPFFNSELLFLANFSMSPALHSDFSNPLTLTPTPTTLYYCLLLLCLSFNLAQSLRLHVVMLCQWSPNATQFLSQGGRGHPKR